MKNIMPGRMTPKPTNLYPLIGRVCFTLPFLFGSVFRPESPDGCAHWQLHLIQAFRLAVLLLSVCVLVGLRARRAAAIITVILIVGSLIDPPTRAVDGFMVRQLQQSLLLQYSSLVGGAMVIGYFGSGPYSLDRQLSRWVRAFFHIRYTDIIEHR
jgi:putative oxidoreductase